MLWIEQLQSVPWSQAFWVIFGGYCLGCLVTGYYVVRAWNGQDLRDLGSGNVGAKNAGRALGWPGFAVTLVGDFSKGAFAIWVTTHFTGDERLIAMALLAVVVGHIWPAQLRFRGGKGVSTTLGALLVWDFHLAIAFALLFAGAFALFRRSVLPGLFAFACLPLVSAYLGGDSNSVISLSILAGLILVAHRKNIPEELSHLAERPPHRSKT
jgi:acyl phosphate:glycerol-3-phosphate acyltransferase